MNVNGSQKYYKGVVGEDWPDSMPLWLEEKWRRDGVGPYTYHEACKLKEQWLKRHGLVCEEINVNDKQKQYKYDEDMVGSNTRGVKITRLQRGRIECDLI